MPRKIDQEWRKGRVSALRKALEVGDGSAGALITEDLEKTIRETLLLLSPLTRMVQNVEATADVHQIVRRTALNRGRHEGELPSPTYGRSTYDRRSVIIKILRSYGQVTSFARAAARKNYDLLAEETMSTIEGMVDLLEFSTMWGMSNEFLFTGDAYMYPGWYQWLLRDRTSGVQVVDADAVITLDLMDQAHAATRKKWKQTQNDAYVWIMSETMNNKVSGLQTRIQRQVQSVEFEGGFVMNLYKGIPILESSFMEPTDTSPSLASGATGGTSGEIADGTYAYKIAQITLYGEQLAGTKSSGITLNGGGNGSVALSWTDDTDAKLWAIYRAPSDSSDDDDYDLLDVIAANTYTNDKPSGRVTTYTDDGSLTALTDVHPLGSGEQNIALVNLSTERGISRPVLMPDLGQPVDDLMNYYELTENTSSYQFMLESFHALQCPWGQTQAIIRRAKTAS